MRREARRIVKQSQSGEDLGGNLPAILALGEHVEVHVVLSKVVFKLNAHRGARAIDPDHGDMAAALGGAAFVTSAKSFSIGSPLIVALFRKAGRILSPLTSTQPSS